MKIQAAIARAGSIVDIETCDLDRPAPDEALVRLEACGICHTDLLSLGGQLGTPLPAVLGHEGVGRIEALGAEGEGFTVGDRVLMSFAACGHCPRCDGGAPAYCDAALPLNFLGRRPAGTGPMSLGGTAITSQYFGQSSFATHTVAGLRNMIRLPEDLPAELMAPLACGVQTGMSAVIKLLGAGEGRSIAVFGCGTVGLAAVMAAVIAGYERIVAVDLREDRIAIAREIGATEVVSGDTQSIENQLRAMAPVDCALDSTGSTAVIESAFARLKRCGQLLCLGVSPGGRELGIDPRELVFTGRSIRGSVEGDSDPAAFVPQMIDYFRAGWMPLHKIVKTYPFAEINRAMADLRSGETVKPVLLMD